MIRNVLLVTIFTSLIYTVFSQRISNGNQPTQDTVAVNKNVEDDLADEKNALRSAAIPGWGQFKNKQYTKSAFFLAAVGTGIYLHIDRSKDYKAYNEAYKSRLQNYATPIDDFLDLNLTQLEQSRADFLSKRDVVRGATAYVYVMNLVDAAAQYKIIREEEGKHSATKAAYYSAILPGLGQAYNKKYWKIPIVYAALGTSIYIANENRIQHRNYEREIEFQAVGETTGFRSTLSETQLERGLETWRQYRDIAYVSTAAIYLLNILDATVDAHLFDFNVDEEDLSFNVDPVFDRVNDQVYYGLQFTIPIN